MKRFRALKSRVAVLLASAMILSFGGNASAWAEAPDGFVEGVLPDEGEDLGAVNEGWLPEEDLGEDTVGLPEYESEGGDGENGGSDTTLIDDSALLDDTEVSGGDEYTENTDGEEEAPDEALPEEELPDTEEIPLEELQEQPEEEMAFAMMTQEALLEEAPLTALPEDAIPAGIYGSAGALLEELRPLYSYGIIAPTIDNKSNQRTNIVAANYTADGNYKFTTDLAGKREVPFIVRSTGAKMIINRGLPAHTSIKMRSVNDAKIEVLDAASRSDVHKYYSTQSVLEAEITSLLSRGVAVSKGLNSTDTPLSIVPEKTGEDIVIDTTGADFGEDDVIVLSAHELTDYFTGGRLTVRKHAGQTVVFNVIPLAGESETKQLELGSYRVEVNGEDYESTASINERQNQRLRDYFISNIIWNIRGFDKVTLDGTAGTFLVTPVMEVDVAGASSGTILVNLKNKTDAGSKLNASWHYLFKERLPQATLFVKKAVDTGSVPVRNFTFEVSEVSSDAPLPDTLKVLNGPDDRVTFPAISYPQGDSDTYIYKIQETAVSDPEKWELNPTPVYAKVTTSEEHGAEVHYYTDEACTQGETQSPEITNVSVGPPTPYTSPKLKVNKTFSVKEGFTLPDDYQKTFSFHRKPLTAGREGDEATVSITATHGIIIRKDKEGKIIPGKASVDFGSMTFQEPGTYEYEIREASGSREGWVFDKAYYKLIVKVSKSKDKKELTGEIAIERYKNEDDDDPVKREETDDIAKFVKFSNTYAPAPLYETLKVTKVVEGTNPPDETFHFVRTRLSGDDPETISIRGSGTASFPEERYGRPGTYTYKIVEKAGSAGYVYDNSVIYARIIVTDHNGTLHKTTTYIKNNVEYTDAVFTNRFVLGAFTFYKVRFDNINKGVANARMGIYRIKATDKSSEAYQSAARDLAEGDFDFDEDWDKLALIEEVVSGTDGNVRFDELPADEYYVIRENAAPRGFQRSKYPIVLHTAYSASLGKVVCTVINSGRNTIGFDEKAGIYKWFEHRVNVVVNKRSSAGGLLGGAVLTLYDAATDKPLERWKSEDTAGQRLRVRLETGKTYYIHEDAAPAGYTKSADVQFTVDAVDVGTSDYVQTVSVVNKRNSSGGGGGGSGSGSDTSSKTEGSKTGDPGRPYLWLIIAGAAALVIILLLFFRRRKK